MQINKVYLGNSEKLLKEIETASVHLVVTDPPYKVTSSGTAGNTGGMLKKSSFMSGKVFQHNDIKPIDYIPEFYRILKQDAHCYIMTNQINLIEMLNVATDCGFHFVKSLIWDKGNKIMGRYYMSQYEYILLFRKGKEKPINNCGTPDILRIPNKKMPNADNGGNYHDTEKPVELMQILIENSSNVGEIVLDPFAGIGSTILASIKTNRNYIGIEIDEKYYNIINQRMGEEKPFAENTLFS
jgi:DNA modification methylase